MFGVAGWFPMYVCVWITASEDDALEREERKARSALRRRAAARVAECQS